MSRMSDSDCAVFVEVASQSEEWHRQLGGHLECNRWDAQGRTCGFISRNDKRDDFLGPPKMLSLVGTLIYYQL